jgi:hypothetical protein
MEELEEELEKAERCCAASYDPPPRATATSPPTASDMERYWNVGAQTPWRGAEVFPRAPPRGEFRIRLVCD